MALEIFICYRRKDTGGSGVGSSNPTVAFDGCGSSELAHTFPVLIQGGIIVFRTVNHLARLHRCDPRHRGRWQLP